MKLTVIIEETGAACNIGGPITHRRITLDLTPEQALALRLDDKWDSYGTTFIELDAADRVCTCRNAMAAEVRCGKSGGAGKGDGTP